MKLGMSGARIEVVKTGLNVADQARYCRDLGCDVAPAIYWIHEDCDRSLDAYSMELLQPAALTFDNFVAMHGVVSELWKQPARVWNGPDWFDELYYFLVGSDSLREKLTELYMHQYDQPRAGLIHGDPTMANLMQRRDGQLVITDPIRPVGKVPSLVDVDRGKLLQSVMGWEVQLGAPEWRTGKINALCQVVLKGLTRLESHRAWFWCAVHLARTVPYTQADLYLNQWAAETIHSIINSLEPL